ncbi:hypothetical protein [Litorisediminicola beolgyonensis]|uniref:DUF4259 domain-containing protein n=1 Tax=Litorisediminicola beolgyonensis TaxID=1173614 RepID=A0ABW3ZDD2_9RHOB
MGSWGVGLYQNDTASDLRDLFPDIARLPIPLGEVEQRLLSAVEASEDAFDPDSIDARLVIADLFHRYGLDAPDALDLARTLIRDGHDLAAKRDLGMSERDLVKRETAMAAVLETWSAPHPKPKILKRMTGPEPFLFEPGDVWEYPTMAGAAFPVFQLRFTAAELKARFQPDGWASFLVADRWYEDEFFARYLVALAMPEPDAPQTVQSVAGAPLMQLVRPKYYNDENDRLAYEMRREDLVFRVLVDKGPRALSAWKAKRIGSLDIATDTLSALADAQAEENRYRFGHGVGSMEHMLAAGSFVNRSTLVSDADQPRVEPSPDRRIADFLR